MGWPKDSRASEWHRGGLTGTGYEGQPRASSFDLEAGVSDSKCELPRMPSECTPLGPSAGKFGVQGFVTHMHPEGWDLGLETPPDKHSLFLAGEHLLHSGTLRPGWRFGHWWLLLGQVIGQTRMGTWSRPHWAHPSCPGGAGGTENEVSSVSQGGKTCS